MSFLSPDSPKNIPIESQWLGGIGAGSWFDIKQQDKLFKIDRFSKDGVLECTALFNIDKPGLDLDEKYKFAYLSHCKLCTITQNNIHYNLIINENKDV